MRSHLLQLLVSQLRMTLHTHADDGSGLVARIVVVSQAEHGVVDLLHRRVIPAIALHPRKERPRRAYPSHTSHEGKTSRHSISVRGKEENAQILLHNVLLLELINVHDRVLDSVLRQEFTQILRKSLARSHFGAVVNVNRFRKRHRQRKVKSEGIPIVRWRFFPRFVFSSPHPSNTSFLHLQ